MTPRVSADISGNARVPVLQLTCNTSGTLKSAQTLLLVSRPLYIVTGTRYDYGALFYCCYDVLAWQ